MTLPIRYHSSFKLPKLFLFENHLPELIPYNEACTVKVLKLWLCKFESLISENIMETFHTDETTTFPSYVLHQKLWM